MASGTDLPAICRRICVYPPPGPSGGTETALPSRVVAELSLCQWPSEHRLRSFPRGFQDQGPLPAIASAPGPGDNARQKYRPQPPIRGKSSPCPLAVPTPNSISHRIRHRPRPDWRFSVAHHRIKRPVTLSPACKSGCIFLKFCPLKPCLFALFIGGKGRVHLARNLICCSFLSTPIGYPHENIL